MVHIPELPNQFGPSDTGMVVIIDGDTLCYQASYSAARLDTAVRRFQVAVQEIMFLLDCSKARVHLTAGDSTKAGRYNVPAAKPYQGNRKESVKPALLESLRIAASDKSNWLENTEVFLHHDIEADDACITDAYRLEEGGILWSEDKDLRVTPYPYYEMKTGKVDPSVVDGGSIALRYKANGSVAVSGRGLKFFWLQMLAGDSADNIQGLKLLRGKRCGPANAYKLLAGKDYKDVVKSVLEAYVESGQNPIPEGCLLHMQRWPDDTFFDYLRDLREVGIIDENLLAHVGFWIIDYEEKLIGAQKAAQDSQDSAEHLEDSAD